MVHAYPCPRYTVATQNYPPPPPEANGGVQVFSVPNWLRVSH